MTYNEIAYQIYLAHYGHLDDKQFSARKQQEIIDWLTEGDGDYNDLPALITEWGEYDAEEIEINRPKLPAAVELGRRGGRSTSDAKRKASAENGKRGGRPRKG